MAEHREWVPVAVLVGLAVLVALLLLPGTNRGSPYSVLSTYLPTPRGAEALYRTMKRLGIPVARRQAPLADAGPVPRALAVFAPEQTLTSREVGNVLSMVREGGTLLWVHPATFIFSHALSDSLGLRVVPLTSRVKVRLRRSRLTEGVQLSGTFHYAFFGRGSLGSAAEPLLVAGDSLIVAFTATYGSGRIVAFADPTILVNENIAQAGVAPIVVRAGAAAAAAGGGPLVFDEFHHGFHGGGVRSGVAHFLAERRLGHVVAQWLVVGFLALLLAPARLGAPIERRRSTRRSPLEHAEALGQIYREAAAVDVPRLLLFGGLARALGEPVPHDDPGAVDLLRRVESRGGSAAATAHDLRESLEAGEADVLAVATDLDRIREEMSR